MNRYEYTERENDDGALVGLLSESENGDYVQYDDVEPIIADRDIKTANLQLLVDKVLAWEVQDSVFQVAPEVQLPWGELMSLARGLKQ